MRVRASEANEKNLKVVSGWVEGCERVGWVSERGERKKFEGVSERSERENFEGCEQAKSNKI